MESLRISGACFVSNTGLSASGPAAQFSVDQPATAARGQLE